MMFIVSKPHTELFVNGWKLWKQKVDMVREIWTNQTLLDTCKKK